MAVYAATGGSAGGKEAWSDWSARNPLHKPEAIDERWANYGRSPPHSIGAGTLFHLARGARPRQERQERQERREDPVPSDAPDDEIALQASAQATADWLGMLQTSEKGGIKGNDFNVLIALQHAPELAGKIAFDVRKGALVALRPGVFGSAGPWTSAKTAGIAIWLQGIGMPAKIGHVDTAVARLGTFEQVDPLEDYLLGLHWDGIERWCGAT